MRKELWDIACTRWDEDDAKALYKVFSEYFDDEQWDDYCSLAFIGTDKDVDDFIFNEFVEINEINPTVEFYLNRDLIVSDWGMDYSREEVTTDEGYTRTVVCREFQNGGTMIIVDTDTGSIRDISINEIVNRINSGDGFSDFEYVYYNHEEYYKNRKDDE